MPIIASNFKTNHTRKSTALFINEVNDYLKEKNISSEVYVFPPATSLDCFNTVSNFTVGTQNAYATASGSFTGEIGTSQLDEFEIKTILIGHSERRHILGESQEEIARKYEFYKELGYKIIYCIGEPLEVKNQEIRKIDEHINGIKQKEAEEIETEKQLVKESATEKKESLIKTFSANADLVALTEKKFTEFINDLVSVEDTTIFYKTKTLRNLGLELINKFKDTITVKVVDIQNELLSKVKDKADSEIISKEISHRFHEIVGQIEGEEKLDNINLYIQTALSEQKQFVSAIEGKAPKKQRVSITKPNVKPKINIETEEEVIAYIGEMEKEMNDLKEKMLNAIKESKIVDVK